MRKYLRSLFALFCLILVGNQLQAQAPGLAWGNALGSWGGNDLASHVCTDASGNVYTSGIFYGKVDFGGTILQAGSSELFITKHDASGNLLWALATGIPSSSDDQYLTVDAAGFVYFTTEFTGTVDMNPGAGTANSTSAGGKDIVVIKYNGNLPVSDPAFFQWRFRVGSTADDLPVSLAVNASGQIFLLASKNGTAAADMDPSANVSNLTGGGSQSLLMAKYDGTVIPTNTSFFTWAFQVAPGTNNVIPEAMKLDANGFLYLTGGFSDPVAVDFDPSTATRNRTSAGSTDIFLVKYDGADVPTATTFCKWATSFGSTASESGLAVDADASGNIFITGSFFSATIDMNPAAGTNNIANAGTSKNIFVGKYNGTVAPTNAAFHQWSFAAGTAENAEGNSISVDGTGNVMVAGNHISTTLLDLDPSANATPVLTNGGSDLWLAKYDGNLLPGSTSFFVWGFGFGSALDDPMGQALMATSGKIILAAGLTGITPVDVDPSAAIAMIHLFGGTSDACIIQYDGSLLISDPGFFQWGKGYGSSGSTHVVNDVATDALGNIYLTGTFTGPADFDPGPGVYTLIANGNDDFVAKYDGWGSLIWAFRLRTTYGLIVSKEIEVDANGNVYISGDFQFPIDLDPSVNNSNLNPVVLNRYNVFAAKYNGNLLPSDPAFFQWNFALGLNNDRDSITAMKVDGPGNVYLGGKGSTSVDFDPSSGTNTVPVGAGGFWLAKYDGNLQPSNTSFHQWAFATHNAPAHLPGRLNDIEVDASGYVYIGGNWIMASDVDPSANTVTLTSAGGKDLFIARYNGNLLPSNTAFFDWAFVAGNSSNESCEGLAIDSNGDLLVTGTIAGTTAVDMNPSANTSNLTGAGGNDIFVAKYDLDFAPSSTSFYQWAFRAGGTGSDNGRDIAIDPSGRAIVTGSLSGTTAIDFDPSSNVNALTGAGGEDIFVAAFNASLLPTNTLFHVWSFRVGDINNDRALSVATDFSGGVVIGGSFNSNTTDFDPTGVSNTLAGVLGVNFGFVARYATTPLPIEQIVLNAAPAGNEVHLNWRVEGTTPYPGFEVERGTGGNFQIISNTPESFLSDGPVPAGHYQYRVSAKDETGQVTYSNVVEVYLSEDEFLSVFPNPARDLVQVRTHGDFYYVLSNLQGQVLMEGPGKESQTLDISRLSSGIYTLKVNNKSCKVVVE